MSNINDNSLSSLNRSHPNRGLTLENLSVKSLNKNLNKSINSITNSINKSSKKSIIKKFHLNNRKSQINQKKTTLVKLILITIII